MIKILLGKGLAVAVILLFISLGIQPAIATVKPEKEVIIDLKDFLFQTIIDVANNPEVKKLFEKYDNDLFSMDIDRILYRKLILRNPKLMLNTLFTKPSMSVKYLNTCYNSGVELSDILGEDKLLETIENIEVTDTKWLDEFNNIITNDEELSSRLDTLKEMNKDIELDSSWDFSVICAILILIYFPLVLVADILAFTWLGILYSGNLLSIIIFGLCLVPVWIFFMVNVLLQELFGCWS